MKNSIIDEILVEWAYRVPDGMPDLKDPVHLIHLEETLNELKLPREVSKKLLQNLRQIGERKDDKADDDKFSKTTDGSKYWVKHKDSKNVYTVVNPDSQIQEPVNKAEAEKQQKKDKPKKEKSEITPEQTAKEKKRNEEISKVLNLFTTKSTEGKGAGRFKLDENDVKIYTEHLNLSPEERQKKQQNILDKQKEKLGEISDTDIDTAMVMLKEKLDSKAYSALVAAIKKKGDPPGEFSTGDPGKERLRNVIKHYLQTGGISAITGKVVAFSDSQLDHMVSLDNGGTDGPHNWEWMESRFNQFKGSRTEPEVKAKLIERGLRTDSEWLLELTEDDMEYYLNEAYVAYWETKFDKGDTSNLSDSEIKDMTNDEIDYLTKAWNNYVGDENDPRFIPRYGDRKAVINGKKMSYSRGGVSKPSKKDPDTWGWINDAGEWKRDPEIEKLINAGEEKQAFEKAKKAFKSFRASGGQKISRDEIQMKLIGGKDEVTGEEYQGVLKTGDGYPPIPDEFEEQEMDEAMQIILGKKLSYKAMIDNYKADRKANPKSSFESEKRVSKALKSQPWYRTWSKDEKDQNPEEYAKWDAKRDDFVLTAWQKELENR